MVISISPKIYQKALQHDPISKEIQNFLRLAFSLVTLGYHTLILEGKTTLKNIREFSAFTSFYEDLTKIEESSFARENEIYRVVLRITDTAALIERENFNPQEYEWIAPDQKRLIKEKDQTRYEYIDWSIASDYLRTDLSIYLENNTSDGDFIKMIYSLIKETTLPDAVLTTCGGINEITKVLERVHCHRRGICIVDSDTQFEGNQNPEINKIQKACRQRGMVFKVLEKRMIENYLPDLWIQIWLEKNTGSSSHPYFIMNPTQKKCFNLKKGLRCKEATKTQIHQLYSDFLQDLDLTGIAADKPVIPPVSEKLSAMFKDHPTPCTKELFGTSLAEFEDVANLIHGYL